MTMSISSNSVVLKQDLRTRMPNLLDFFSHVFFSTDQHESLLDSRMSKSNETHSHGKNHMSFM